MLDIKFIREHTDRVKEEIHNRGMNIDLDRVLELDKRRRFGVQAVDELRAEQNSAAEKFLTLSDTERMVHKDSLRQLKERVAEIDSELAVLEKQWITALLQLPNITHESVPIGPDSSGNVVVKTVGQKREFDFEPLPHQDIPGIAKLIDAERGAKVSGSRFYYLKGQLAQLEVALMHYAFDFYIQKGFTPMMTPMLVREEAMLGTGFFPADKNEIYSINADEDNLYLVGTAEVPLAAYHLNETLDVTSPVRYVGYSSCFRREAGTYGRDTKGIMRVHQFNKVEMFIFSDPSDSWSEHELLLAYAEEFLDSLGLHYQVLNMCTGDIGAPNAKKYDIETWMPGQNAYRETNSCSHDTDFQARRLQCKYRDAEGKKQFVHTLNNTGCADTRTLIAIIENYQQKDGSVIIPEVLRSYTHFDSIKK